MKNKLAENVRAFRRALGMTQEQLAEAVGVSVGSVYKWEAGKAVPELGLILDMADLFRVSTDVLLGYEWRTGGAGAALERIEALAAEKSYAEAAREAEKALRSWPNSFEVSYRCALLYLEMGEGPGRASANRQAVELLDRACELMDQNQDESLSETDLRTLEARAHLRLGNTGTALRILKKYNVCGVNNAFIGMVLGDFLHDADGAELYLSRAFAPFAERVNNIMVGYINVFYRRGEYAKAVDCARWLRVVLRGIQPEEKLTKFDKYDCVLLELLCEGYCLMKDRDAARRVLAEAAAKAARFDSAPPGEVGEMDFYAALGVGSPTGWEEDESSAMETLRRRVRSEATAIPGLAELWREVTGEEAPV